jgi:poly(3-hydroxybutyrate) depolymerase
MAGRVTQDIDGTQVIWDFFHDHALQAGKAAGAGTE